MNEYFNHLVDIIFSTDYLKKRVLESTTKDMFIMVNCADNWQYIKGCSFYGRVSDDMIEQFGIKLKKRFKNEA